LRFVKTPDEIKKIQSVYARCQFLGARTLSVAFETTSAAVRALLPPPLEPTAEPLGLASIGEVSSSNCVGAFKSGGLFIRARYRDIIGNYCLVMPTSTPEAMTFGRELFGEPRKMAKIIFERQDEFVWGSAERQEVRYLSLRGRLTGMAATGRYETSDFFFKYSPRADGIGFDSPPQLVQVLRDTNIEAARRGRGELILRDSPHDTVADIPITQVIEAVYTESHVYNSARVLCEVDPEAFLPYAFAKADAFEVVNQGTLLHAQAARKTRAGRGQWRNQG